MLLSSLATSIYARSTFVLGLCAWGIPTAAGFSKMTSCRLQSNYSSMFATVVQFGPLELFDHYNFEISNIQDGAAIILKNRKSPYISIRLTDLHETLYIDAVWSSWPFWSLKFRKFKNPRRRRPPFWKIGIWPYSRNCLTEHYETWYGDAYCHPDRGDRHNFEIL